MAGSLCGSLLTIDTASIIDTLQVGFSAITVDLTGVPSVFSSVVSDATTQLSSSFEPLLTSVVEPAVRPVVEQQLSDASTFAPVQLIPIQAQLVRNSIQSAFQGLVGTRIQLFGGND